MTNFKTFFFKNRYPILITFFTVGSVFIFQNFTAVPTGPTAILEVKSVPVTVCGQNFQRIVVDGQSQVKVSYVHKKVGALTFALPDHFSQVNQQSPSSVTLRHSSTNHYQATLPILPLLPTMDDSPAGLKPGLCDMVKNYLKIYNATAINTNTQLVSFSSINGFGTLEPIANRIKPNPTNEANIVKTKSNSRYSQLNYLIIAQDLYRNEADQLAAFRNSKGISTSVTSLSELPGYKANDPTPAQCEAPYDHECYHYWGDPIDNVSQLAVPSMIGFHQETTFAQQYTRVSYIPGLIRAYLRQMKADRGISAVLIIGDPEQVPPIYTPKTDMVEYGRSPGCSTWNWVNENEDYCNGGAQFTLGTDLFYALPSLKLNDQHQVNMAQITPGMLTCQSTDQNNVVHRQMKVWCEGNEGRYWGDMSAYGWSPYYPLTRIFDDPVTAGINPGNFDAIPASEYIAVGRIITQTRYRHQVINPIYSERLVASSIGISINKDPAVQNYVNKLIYWESHLPGFYNDSVATLGGNETWLWNDGSSDNDANMLLSIYNNSTYPGSSQVYASNAYLPDLPSASTFCNSSNCKYDTNENIMNAFATSTHTAWPIAGHGGHGAVLGTFNVPSPTTSAVFGMFESFGNAPNDHIAESTPNSTAYINLLLGTKNHLVGHVVANSCDASSYLNYNSALEMQLKMDPRVEPASFAENMIRQPGGGAINTYMNYFAGWGGGDNEYNYLFMNYVKAAYTAGEPIGTALVNLQHDIMTNPNDIYYGHQLVNRVFLGDPFATIAGPNATNTNNGGSNL